MWHVVRAAGCVAVLAAAPGPACVASQVESCVATMKNVFATPEQTREYCTRAAQKACEPEAQEAR